MRNFLNALPDAAVGWHPAAGKWCIKEIIGHLSEEDERDFVGRIRRMLEEDEPHLTVNDQDAVARMRRDCVKNVNALLNEFGEVRSESIAFLSALKEEDLERGGIHPKIGRLQVGNLVHEWIYHDMNHIRQIAGNVQSFLWEHLGNMQQFYKP